MGLLVNGPLPKHETRAQLQRMDILRHFEHIVYSGELSSGLAHVSAWPNVLRQIGVAADSLALVAHDDCLLSPAKLNGVTTIAYQCPKASADLQIGQLGDLAMLANSSQQLQAA